MESIPKQFGHVGGSSRRIARRLMAIGEDRLELFLLELVEEREHIIRSLVIALGIFAFGLLAMMTLTAAIVVGFRNSNPVLILGVITVLYGTVACVLAFLLRGLMKQSEPFSATLDQLRKDRESLEIELS